jgi:hypothetical protein
MSADEMRRGDTVDASTLLTEIQQLRWRSQLMDRVVKFVIEGSNNRMTETEAMSWVKESSDMGYSRIRYILVDDDGQELTVQLAAIAPG